jgi:hypothetical protein
MKSRFSIASVVGLLAMAVAPALACGDGKPCVPGNTCDDKTKKSSAVDAKSVKVSTKTHTESKPADKAALTSK